MLVKLVVVTFVSVILTTSRMARAEPDPPAPFTPAPPPRQHLSTPAAAQQGPTKADIPANLPSDLRGPIENTFSAIAAERGKAARLLGDMHERAALATPFLIALLSDETVVGSRDIRVEGMWFSVRVTVGREAYDAICKIGKAALEPCIVALRRYAGTVRGDELVEILGASKDPRAVEPLITLMKHRDPLVRNAVVRSLYSWNDPRFLPALVGALRDDDAEVRESTVWVLRDLHDPRLVLPLVDVLKDKAASVRQGAARALGEQGDRRAVPALLNAFRDTAEDIGVRYASACSLGKIADPPPLDGLLAILKDRSMPEAVRSGAAAGLAMSKDQRFVEPLVALAKDGREADNLRGNAVEAIADIEGSRAVPFLTRSPTVASEDAHVRCCAAMLVVKLTNGAVSDVGVVAALEGRYSTEGSITAVVEGRKAQRKAVREVAERGRTEAVRAAATALLKKWDGGEPSSAAESKRLLPHAEDPPNKSEK